MKKHLVILLGVVLLMVVFVSAAGLNLGSHTQLDFGVMNVKESKTLDYLVKGFFVDGQEYYSVCVTHTVEGDLSKWLRVKVDESSNITISGSVRCKGKDFKHWVGPDNGKFVWDLDKNVHVTVKVPKGTAAGIYNGIISNDVCMKNSPIGLCSQTKTVLRVEVK